MQLVRGEDLVQVLAGERLALQRVCREVVEAPAVRSQQGAGAAVGLPRQRHRRKVDVAAGAVGEGVVAGGEGDRRRPVGIQRNPHPEFADHLLADGVHARQVIDGAGVGVPQHLFLGGAAAQQGDDLIEQLVARLQVGVLLGRVGNEAKRRPARHDAEDLGRVEAEQVPAQRVARLVVGDDAPLFCVQPSRLLRADRLAQQCLVEVLARHRAAFRPPGDDRALVESVGELRTGHPGGLARNVGQVEIVGERLAFGVRAKDRLAPVAVRRCHEHLAVEAPGPQQRVVELVDVVGGGDDDHRAGIALEPVQLDQQLVERLLALARSAVAAPTTPRAPHRVELVDEDHRPARLARLFEQPPDPGCTPPDEHLDEARSRGGEEVDPGLCRHRPRQHRLAGPGRAEEQHAAGRLSAESGEAVGVAQPLGDVHQLVLGRVDALHLLPEHRLRTAGLDRLGLGGAHRGAHKAQEDEEKPRHEDDPEDGVPVEEKALNFGGHR